MTALTRPRPSHRPGRLHGRRQDDARLRSGAGARAQLRRRRRRDRARGRERRSRRSSPPAARASSGCSRSGGSARRSQRCEPTVIALGGGALGAEATRTALREQRLHDTGGRRLGRGLAPRRRRRRPPARPRRGELPQALRRAPARLPRLRRRRRSAIWTSAILAAGGVEVAPGALARLGELAPARARSRWSPTRTSTASTAPRPGRRWAAG